MKEILIHHLNATLKPFFLVSLKGFFQNHLMKKSHALKFQILNSTLMMIGDGRIQRKTFKNCRSEMKKERAGGKTMLNWMWKSFWLLWIERREVLEEIHLRKLKTQLKISNRFDWQLTFLYLLDLCFSAIFNLIQF